jgi:hypothetical protein
MSKDENKSPKLWPEGQSKEKHEVGTVNKFSILYNIFTNLIIKDLAVYMIMKEIFSESWCSLFENESQ